MQNAVQKQAKPTQGQKPVIQQQTQNKVQQTGTQQKQKGTQQKRTGTQQAKQMIPLAQKQSQYLLDNYPFLMEPDL